MARGMAVTVVFAAVLVVGRTASAADSKDVVVTVHVEDYACIGAPEWIRVKQMVEDIFSEAGVWLSWAGPLRAPVQDWPLDGMSRVAVVITNIQSPFAGDLADTADVLGRAAPQYSRAWVFANRIAAASATSTVDRTTLLARAIAHEIGHLLMPTESHSERGIMKGGLALTQVGFFGFTPEQATAMQKKRLRSDGRVRPRR
jgi:hypothetical protein